MKIVCIGDIIGRPGRRIIKEVLRGFIKEEGIDFVIANGENASHGFGLTPTNAQELIGYGIHVLTGGNHTWDKKEIIPFLKTHPNILRPGNYPSEVPGSGIFKGTIGDEKIAVINLMGHYGMPMVENPFRWIDTVVNYLHQDGYQNIIVDMHAETTSEKRALLMMLKGKVSAIFGTHTHVGTDDLVVDEGTGYITDVGLTGCRDNVIGMDSKVPIERFMTGLPGRFEVPEKCKKILQFVLFEVEQGRCLNATKYKFYDSGGQNSQMEALIERS